MGLSSKQELSVITIIQLCTLIFVWAFFFVVTKMNALPLPHASAIWVYQNSTETTIVVTVLATIVSSLTLTCFTRAAKHALRQHIGARGAISLADLSLGSAVANAEFRFKRELEYIGPTLATLIIAASFGLVNSAWTTFLQPVQLIVQVPMTGEELDLSNPAFDAVLGLDMNNTFSFSGGTLVTPPDSANSLTSFAFTGGLTSATVYASEQPGILNFNSVAYNVSTGGVLSAVYSSPLNTTSTSISAPGTPASFGGGPIPTNLKATSHLAGISSTYSVTQQGFTANVSCFNYTNPADWYPLEVEAVSVNATFEMDGYVSGIMPVVNTTLPQMICNANATAGGMIASMAAVNFNNSDYLASATCPFTWLDSVNSQKIVVYHIGVGRYASLPPTICEIALLVTQSSVTYDSWVVTPMPQNASAIPYQRNINFWVTLFVMLQQWGFQTPRVNSLGNMLLSLLSTGSTTFSEAPVQSYQLFLEYWKGVVEVTGTALRSGYTAYPQNITSSMLIPMVGTESITTMGWKFNKLRTYSLAPITFTALMTFAAIGYALHYEQLGDHGVTGQVQEQGEGQGQGEDQEQKQKQGQGQDESGSTSTENVLQQQQQHSQGRVVVPRTPISAFDASNPMHLFVALAAQQHATESQAVQTGRYWERYEDIVVHFEPDR